MPSTLVWSLSGVVRSPTPSSSLLLSRKLLQLVTRSSPLHVLLTTSVYQAIERSGGKSKADMNQTEQMGVVFTAGYLAGTFLFISNGLNH